MKTLITGGGGFVGLNIAEALLRAGDDVIVLGNQDPPAYAMAALGQLPGKLDVIRADVSDRDAIDAAFSQSRPHRVVHAATITAGADRELREFDRIIDVNIKGTANVLRAALACGVGKFVYVSSGEVSRAWCERLRGEFPHLQFRAAAGGESANVAFLGSADRAAMRIDRLNADTGFRAVFDAQRAFDDYLDWIRTHAAFFDATKTGAAGT